MTIAAPATRLSALPTISTRLDALVKVVGPAVLAGAYAWHSLAANYVVDDGFISFQYVKNFLAGAGLVYNAGERVEGYTGFLWIVLLAGVQRLLPDVALVDIARTLGILFGALTILLVCHFSRTVAGRTGPAALLGGLFLAANAGLAAWGTGGLETTLFAFFVFAGAYAYARYLSTGDGFFLAPILFALASLTRPDGLLFLGLTWLHLVATARARTGRWLTPGVLTYLAVAGVIYVPYFAWRFAYYGYPFPNTFYAKVGSGLYQYLRGLNYLWAYAVTYGGLIAFFPAAALLLRRRREPWRDYVALLLAGYLAYVVYVGGDGLAFSRFVVYVAPLAYLLAQEGFLDLLSRVRQWGTPTAWAAAQSGALAVAAIAVVGLGMQQSVGTLLFPNRYRYYEPQSELSFPNPGGSQYAWFDDYFIDRQAAAARWLDRNAPPGSLVASTPAGAIAYYMRLPVIDMLGLNDLVIARSPGVYGGEAGRGRPGHEKGDGKYVLSRDPDYILLGNVAVLPRPIREDEMASKLVLKSEHEIWDDPAFHRDYQIACVRLSEGGLFQYFTFYKHRGRDLPPETSDSGSPACAST